jgi:hypothetical protein
MKSISLWLVRTVLASLLSSAMGASAQSGEPPPFVAYSGESGYQEISLRVDEWYVAFHGARKHAMASVETAWLARAAQLCAAGGKQYVVELNYVGDRVYESERLSGTGELQENLSHKVAGVVYIPIITSYGPREIRPMLTPSKMAAIRCATTVDGLRAGKTGMSVSDALAKARSAGITLP